MGNTIKKIVVAGDITVDWLMYPVSAQGKRENWRLYAGMHSRPLPGGALLLARFLQQALQTVSAGAIAYHICAPQLPESLGALSPDEIIHSNVMLKKMAGKGPSTYRIEKMLGYMGPKTGVPSFLPLKPEPDPDLADIIVLDDAGNGFRCDRDSWPAALANAQDSLVIYKLSRPLARGELWKEVRDILALNNLLVIINANDLRQIPGVNISKSLSWERTAADFLFYLYRSETLTALKNCPYLVVLFGTEGAILNLGGEAGRATLIFEPSAQEGWRAARLDGRMMGLTAIFTATLTSELAVCGLPGLENGIKRGLSEARTLLEAGYLDTPAGVDYPLDRLFRSQGGNLPYASCSLARPRDLRRPDPDFWRILDQKTHCTLPLVAADIVKNPEALGLKEVPSGTFGKLETIDRREIESYSSIRELLGEFLADPQPKHPLCFAIFGPPGSGKSFGVKQVVKSLDDKRLTIMTFNLSQFRQYQDLVDAFHKVRDMVLAGKVPVVLLDEFDSAWEGQALGWLKYFLAPMQDGEFVDGRTTFHLGKTVLVFIGGTKHSYEDFTKEMRLGESPSIAGPGPEPSPHHGSGHLPPPVQPPTCCKPESGGKISFRDVKGPDFVSRLRGFINIMGPNRQHQEDDAFVLRRAKILRVCLSLNSKTANLFDPDKMINIDDGILRAFLHITEYRHGARSMEAIIEMSRLAGSQRFSLASLPPKDQLAQHVDADEFMWLTEKERFQSILSWRELEADGTKWHWSREQEMIEKLGGLIHEDYVRHRQAEGITGPTVKDFEDLPEDKKQSNWDAAEDIPHKLKIIRHGLCRISMGPQAKPPDISDAEVMKLAVEEHERFCREQRLQGYRYGQEKDLVKKTTPCLVPFNQLPPEIQKYNLEEVYAVPYVLQKMGFEVYRMEETQELGDPYLEERLASEIHTDYVREREKEGQTTKDYPNLVAYDELTEGVQETNLDQARSIPRKLRRLGYALRHPGPGETPTKLTLSREEIEEIAKMEHARWNWQKILQGWIYGKEKNEEQQTHPGLVPWDQLPEDVKEYDRQTARLIPQFLLAAGYMAYKPNEQCST